MNKQPVKV